MQALNNHHRSEGGIGGTGVQPGVIAVFGTITDPSSLEVNGLRVALPPAVRRTTFDQAMPAAGLAMGDVVAVELERRGGLLNARHLSRFLPLVGPIERQEPEAGTIVVMGTPVQLSREGVHDRWISRLRTGDWVAVSGLWRNASVVASRVEPVPPQPRALISGLLGRTEGGWTTGGTAIDLRCCVEPAEQGFATVSGRYLDGRMVAERLAAGAVTLFPRPADRLMIEAFLARDAQGSGLHLSGVGFPVDRSSTVVPALGRRSIFVGNLRDTFRIEQSLPLPEAPAERQRLLDDLPDRLLLD